MARKISFLILSVVILIIGITGFSKLNYWNRSVRIFSFNAGGSFEGRTGIGQDGRGFESREGEGRREGFERPEMRDLPDSLRVMSEAGEGRRSPGMRDRNIPDSIRQQFGPGNGDRRVHGTSEGVVRPGEGRGRGEFQGGKKINLRNVKWFLAVFASLTVLAIYIDMIFGLIRRRKGQKSENCI
jgi:hypothetical protein